MDRHLLDYLPPVLRDVVELQAINGANEPEIVCAWAALARVLENQFLDAADEAGLARWEGELKILPKDTDTLEARRARIKAQWNLELPYTLPWLKSWLAGLCGADGYQLAVEDYTIHVELDHTKLPEARSLAAQVLDMLLTVRPCNMQVIMTALLQSRGVIAHGACAESAQQMEIWPQLVTRLESQGRAAVGGFVEYHARVTIEPKEEESYVN